MKGVVSSEQVSSERTRERRRRRRTRGIDIPRSPIPSASEGSTGGCSGKADDTVCRRNSPRVRHSFVIECFVLRHCLCRSCRVFRSARLLRSRRLDQRRRTCGGTICRFFVLSGVGPRGRYASADFVTMFLTLRSDATILRPHVGGTPTEHEA